MATLAGGYNNAMPSEPSGHATAFAPLVDQLKSKSDKTRRSAASKLRNYVETQMKEMPTEARTRFISELEQIASGLMDDADPCAKRGSIMFIDELIDVSSRDPSFPVGTFAALLMSALPTPMDDVLQAAARAVGHLSNVDAALHTNFFDNQILTALDWLAVQGKDATAVSTRYCGVYVLAELADAAPAAFIAHVSRFLTLVWQGVHDPRRPAMRQASVTCVKKCIAHLARRGGDQNGPGQLWQIFHHCRIALQVPNQSPETAQGCLEILGELLAHPNDMIRQSYGDMRALVMAHKDAKSALVRGAVVALVPALARLDPDTLVNSDTDNLDDIMRHLLGCLRQWPAGERSGVYIALGELTAIMGPGPMQPFMGSVVDLLKTALTAKWNGKADDKRSAEAIQCVRLVARTAPRTLVPHIDDLLDSLFSRGLTQDLTVALSELAANIPSVRPAVQERMLGYISFVLTGYQFSHLTPGKPRPPAPRSVPAPIQDSAAIAAPDTIRLAIESLADLDLGSEPLTDFVADCVINFLDHTDPAIRLAAATTSAAVLVPRGQPAPTRGKDALVVGEALFKLLVTGFSDESPAVRERILTALDPRYDHYLSEAEALKSLFCLMYDEVVAVREAAVAIVGRLADFNPAFIVPAVRSYLIELLGAMEHPADTGQRETTARLLGHLIRSCPGLLRTHVLPVMRALLARVTDDSPGTATQCLTALGNLAEVGAAELAEHLPELLPLILELLRDQSSVRKRVSAFQALGKLAQHTGYVMEPYTTHPELLQVLLTSIQRETNSSVRREATRVLGIFGGLDPYRYKLLLQQTSGAGAVDTKGDRPGVYTTALVEPRPGDELMPHGAPVTEEYYAAVALRTLLRVTRDPSLRDFHPHAFRSIVHIHSILRDKGSAFVADSVPAILAALRGAELSSFQRRTHFSQLALLVNLVRKDIAAYTADIVELVHANWPGARPSLLAALIDVVEHLSVELADVFMPHLPRLIPRLVQGLDACSRLDTPDAHRAVIKTLEALEGLGVTLDPFNSQFVGPVCGLFDPGLDGTAPHAGLPATVRIAALQTLARLSRCVNMTTHVCQIVPPLRRTIERSEPAVVDAALSSLCAVVYQLGRQYYPFFIPQMHRVLAVRKLKHPVYQALVNQILDPAGGPLDPSTLEPIMPSIRPRSRAASIEATRQAALAVAPAENLLYAFSRESPAIVDIDTTITLDEDALREVWAAQDHTSRDDWMGWLRRLSAALTQHSPSPSIRSCATITSVLPSVAADLMSAAFVSVWAALSDPVSHEFAGVLSRVLQSESLPVEVRQTLLRLAEYLEHVGHALPIDTRVLCDLARRARAYAKALRYQEQEFEAAPQACVEQLISLNNHLQLPEAATGILVYSQQLAGGSIALKESWLEELERWDEALEAYEVSHARDPGDMIARRGRLRCLTALGRWGEVEAITEAGWDEGDGALRETLAPFAARAAMHLKRWSRLGEAAEAMPASTEGGAFYKAVLAIHSNQFDKARGHIAQARAQVDTELAALVGESYDRAYQKIVTAQTLVELEEVVQHRTTDAARRATIEAAWDRRLWGMQRDPDVWLGVLAVRGLVLSPLAQCRAHIKLASMCRVARRHTLSYDTLSAMFTGDLAAVEAAVDGPYTPDLAAAVTSAVRPTIPQYQVSYAVAKHLLGTGRPASGVRLLAALTESQLLSVDAALFGKVLVRLGSQLPSLPPDDIEVVTSRIIGRHERHGDALLQAREVCYRRATRHNPTCQKAWTMWAGTCSTVVARMTAEPGAPDAAVRHYLLASLQGYFRSISLNPERAFPAILHILTLWFAHGDTPHFEDALLAGFGTVPMRTWLSVIPQIIARLHVARVPIRNLVHQLLETLGKEHPQALVYPLTVASKGHSSNRQADALAILDKMRLHSAALVEQALTVSHELIRVAILWAEQWRAALEEASRQFFTERNIEAMLATLGRVHMTLERGAQTISEVAFVQQFGAQLQETFELCRRYTVVGDVGLLTSAWNTYFEIFKAISKQLNGVTTLELARVAPQLLAAANLDLAVPGGYDPDSGPDRMVRVVRFRPQLQVILSKQRPRKLTVLGSNGKEYLYLLKGHEDTRQDERMMQFFGLVNYLLGSDRSTARNDLSIQRYAVIPLSPNSGLIGWVPHGDTLHHLIREFRERRNIFGNMELRLMYQVAPGYDHLALLMKVDAFQHAMAHSAGTDLAKVLWAKAPSSEAWLKHRTNYTRSLATMSMVGYLLGLGDRHPSNLMLDRMTGKVIHIDFGDSFEVAMHRAKYPEKIPFRLTRMLTRAMEASQIEGSFRLTCEATMRVMRANKQSLLALLEAFVFDPVLSWNLVNVGQAGDATKVVCHTEPGHAETELFPGAPPLDLSAGMDGAGGVPSPDGDVGEKFDDLMKGGDSMPRSAAAGVENDDIPAELNEKARIVIERVTSKLIGTDFGDVENPLNIPRQVHRLIMQATNLENLCQAYVGWCAHQ